MDSEHVVYRILIFDTAQAAGSNAAFLDQSLSRCFVENVLEGREKVRSFSGFHQRIFRGRHFTIPYTVVNQGPQVHRGWVGRIEIHGFQIELTFSIHTVVTLVTVQVEEGLNRFWEMSGL
jgi:hypothetical protein